AGSAAPPSPGRPARSARRTRPPRSHCSSLLSGRSGRPAGRCSSSSRSVPPPPPRSTGSSTGRRSSSRARTPRTPPPPPAAAGTPRPPPAPCAHRPTSAPPGHAGPAGPVLQCSLLGVPDPLRGRLPARLDRRDVIGVGEEPGERIVGGGLQRVRGVPVEELGDLLGAVQQLDALLHQRRERGGVHVRAGGQVRGLGHLDERLLRLRG